MEAIPDSNGQASKTARLVAGLFLFVCVPLAGWSLGYVPSKIMVPLDPMATARNLLANEFIFRTAIVGHIASSVTFAFMALLLYRLFSPVDKHLSRLMLAPVIAQLSIILMLEVFNIAALMILKGDVVQAGQREDLSFLLMRMHRYGIGASQLFWGLFLIPFGMLCYKSRFIPQILGILVVISGIGYMADCLTFILLQRSDFLMIRPFIRITFAGFMLSMLWLLIKGMRSPKLSE